MKGENLNITIKCWKIEESLKFSEYRFLLNIIK